MEHKPFRPQIGPWHCKRNRISPKFTSNRLSQCLWKNYRTATRYVRNALYSPPGHISLVFCNRVEPSAPHQVVDERNSLLRLLNSRMLPTALLRDADWLGAWENRGGWWRCRDISN